MGGKASRAKGSSLERDTAKVLSMYFFSEPSVMRRTPLSGGWGQQHGDISIDPQKIIKYQGKGQLERISSLHFECKSRKSYQADLFFKTVLCGLKNRSLTKLWQDTTEQAGRKTPVLIFRIARVSDFVMTTVVGLGSLGVIPDFPHFQIMERSFGRVWIFDLRWLANRRFDVTGPKQKNYSRYPRT